MLSNKLRIEVKILMQAQCIATTIIYKLSLNNLHCNQYQYYLIDKKSNN